jgi:hypothetical protein
MGPRMEKIRQKRIVAVAVVVLVLGISAPALAAGATVDRFEGPFETVVPVADADNPIGAELMFAECEFVQRVEQPDGSAVETQACILSGPFFDFPGSVPDQAYNRVDGACAWASDYRTQTAGGLVIADGAHITVTPSGNVHITSTYPAEPIPLGDCGIV